jgi:hypothetical protein
MGKLVTGLFAAVLACVPADDANGDLLQNLENAPSLVGISLPPQWRNAQRLLVKSAARQLPVAASQTVVTYRYDAASGRYERTDNPFGSMPFMERADTLGRNVWDLSFTGQYLQLLEYDGNKVGEDPFPVIAGGSPVAFSATPKPIYHVGGVNITYGVLDDLDVNVLVPLINRDFDFNVPTGNPSKPLIASHNNVSLNVGDIHLRGKYRAGRVAGWTSAIGLDLRVPSGSMDEALGTGDVEVAPYAAFSRLFADRVETLFNAGFNLDASETRESSVYYSFGLNVIACRWATILGSLAGRDDVDSWRSAAAISGPHLVNGAIQNTPYGGMDFAERKDYFDAGVGARFRAGEHLAVTIAAYTAINDDGLRSDTWSPVARIEGWF